MQSRIGKISDKALAEIGSGISITDVGYPLDLRTPHGEVKFLLGPMTGIEAKQKWFPNRDVRTLPEVGVYFDADYVFVPDEGAEPMKREDISKKIELFSLDSWDAHLRLRQLVVS